MEVLSACKELNSLEEAVLYAIQLHQNNQLDGAEALYLRILEAAPDQPDALHYLGMIRFQRGKPEEAMRLILQAIERAPDCPDCYNNIGNIFTSTGNVEAAIASYERAIELVPERADLHNNLGVARRIMGDAVGAEAAFWRAIELDAGHFRAYNNLGMLCASRDDAQAAVKYYCTAITLRPQHPDGHKLLGIAYCTLGQLDKAAEVFRSWMVSQPDDPVARHHYAACSGVNVPERATDDYIEQCFDRFASSFEEQLKVRLSYKAPELIVSALLKYLPPAQYDILDAGCGTGLCGPLVAAHAARLVGVDLSLGMLQKAEGKECYDQLIKAELTDFLGAPEQAANFDVMLSADTLCYFGPLEKVMKAAHNALRPEGLLVFSVEDGGERAEDAGHVINPHGRYAHASGYVRVCLENAGFEVLGIESATLRTEGGNPVQGLVVVARRDRACEPVLSSKRA